MKDQIIKIMEAENLSPARFADEIGVQRSNVSHILSDRNKPSYDFIMKILNRFSGINADWLLTGKGNMIRAADSEKMSQKAENTLFDNTIIPETSNQKNNTGKNQNKADINVFNEFTNVNRINYILVFYEDKTFEKFAPRQ